MTKGRRVLSFKMGINREVFNRTKGRGRLSSETGNSRRTLMGSKIVNGFCRETVEKEGSEWDQGQKRAL